MTWGKEAWVVCVCAGSRSQNTLNTTVSDCTSLKKLAGIPADLRSYEEIFADELPTPEDLDAMEKAAIRSHTHTNTHTQNNNTCLHAHLFCCVGTFKKVYFCIFLVVFCLCLQAAMSGKTAGERRGVRVRPKEEPGVCSPGPGVSVRGANQVRTFQLSSESQPSHELQRCGGSTSVSTVCIPVLHEGSLCLSHSPQAAGRSRGRAA